MSKITKRISLIFKSRRKSWQRFAKEFGAEFIENGALHPFIVKKEFETFGVHMTTFNKMIGRTQMTGTILSANCKNEKNLEFILTRKTLLNKLLKNGFQKVSSVDDDFNRLFVIYGTNQKSISKLFDRETSVTIRNQTPYNDITIELFKGEGMSELKLSIYPVIKDVNQLKSLFQLMIEIAIKIDN